MRNRITNNKISVNAVAGTAVVLLGLNAEESASNGLLGFRIYRKAEGCGDYIHLINNRYFENAEPESTGNPFQVFLWGDYNVKKHTTYSYRVVPVYGAPSQLVAGDAVELTIKTEDTEDATHAIYFNRGVAGSQAYSRKFGTYMKWYNTTDFKGKILNQYLKPEDVPERAAFKWLSRGLEEGMLGFIAKAQNADYSIRAAVYEFTYLPVIQAFIDAIERGVDVKIIHHAKLERSAQMSSDKTSDITLTFKDKGKAPVVYKNKTILLEENDDSVSKAALNAIDKVGLTNKNYSSAFNSMLIPRKDTQISHNKFIILSKNGKPIQVWTGSTNFTDGGIFGQSNVGHIIRDETVAQKYYEYWEKLSTDPIRKSKKGLADDAGIANWTAKQQPDLIGIPPENSITPIFSPRLTNSMLNWYAERIDAAKNSVFFTAAFSVADQIFEKVKVAKQTDNYPFLRYLLLEGISGLIKTKYPAIAAISQNRIAWGDTLKTRSTPDDQHHQFIETLSGLNDHVNYLHTKFMLIDPLSNDPIVITGSANFSEASTTENDENMVVIRGNTRVADIFLGEFMRLFDHFHYRNYVNSLSDEDEAKVKYLASDDSWLKSYYTDGTQQKAERLLFS